MNTIQTTNKTTPGNIRRSVCRMVMHHTTAVLTQALQKPYRNPFRVGATKKMLLNKNLAFLLVGMLLLGRSAIAQTYTKINQDLGIVEHYGSENVTLTPIGGAGINGSTICGSTSASLFGVSGGTMGCSFSVPVNSMRIPVLLDGNGGSVSLSITVNGSPYSLTAANIISGVPDASCDATVAAISGGDLTNAGDERGYPNAILQIAGPINSIVFSGDGAIFGLYFFANSVPSFVNGDTQSLTVCGAGATDISSLLTIHDADAGQTETWWAVSGPSNGSLSGLPATATSTGPSGITYTPSAGYTGTDAFTVGVTDGYGDTVSTIVTVTAGYAPTITCSGNIIQSADAGLCSSVVDYIEYGSIIIPPPTITYTQNPGTAFAVGVTTVTATSTNSCGTQSCSFTVTVNDTQSPVITAPTAVTVNADPGTCAATGVALGTATATDNCAVNTATYSNDAPASFPVGTTVVHWTVYDIHGNISNTATQNVTVVDNQNPTITAPANVTVNGNCTPVSVALGTPVTADNCGVAGVTNNWTGGAFPIGTTTVTWTVTDIHGNTATATQSITINPAILSFATTIDNATCNGLPDGYIAADASGGTAPYSYTWSTGGEGIPFYNNLYFAPAGTYTITATDANGCSQSATYTVTQPARLNITAATANVSCYGAGNGSINTTVTGGTPGYNYLWSNGSHAADPAGLSTGTYAVVVTDAHLCIAAASYTISQPAVLSLSAAATNETCHGGSNGSINTTVTGGTLPYTYVWSNGSGVADQAGLAAGTYSVTVTDAHSCVATGAYAIAQPSAISITATTYNVSCYGNKNGSITAKASGGTPGYSYVWSTGSHAASLSGLSPASYTFTVTDANGCTAAHTYTITQPAALGITATVTGASCAGCTNGSINTTVSGGTPAYSYLWSNGSHLADPTGLAAAIYAVTVTDANGCTVKGSYTVTQPSKGKSGGRESSSDSTAGVTETVNIPGDIKVFPNPNKGAFSIKGAIGITDNAEVSLQVTNLLGQVIYSSQAATQNGAINEQVQLNDAVPGMYILYLSSGDQNKAFHIVVGQ